MSKSSPVHGANKQYAEWMDLDMEEVQLTATSNPSHGLRQRNDSVSSESSGEGESDAKDKGKQAHGESSGTAADVKETYLRASQRPVVVVAKRNARERKRVHTVNQAFLMLKYHLPALRSRSKRVSKLKILKAAIDYIYALSDILEAHDANAALAYVAPPAPGGGQLQQQLQPTMAHHHHHQMPISSLYEHTSGPSVGDQLLNRMHCDLVGPVGYDAIAGPHRHSFALAAPTYPTHFY